MKNYSKFFTVFGCFILLTSPSLAMKPSKASVQVTAKLQPDKRVELSFKIVPTGDLVINKDGPWKLQILSAGKLKLEKNELKRADWKEDLAGFSLKSAPAKTTSETIKYKLTAFICTKDKSQCFREVIDTSAQITW